MYFEFTEGKLKYHLEKFNSNSLIVPVLVKHAKPSFECCIKNKNTQLLKGKTRKMTLSDVLYYEVSAKHKWCWNILFY